VISYVPTPGFADQVRVNDLRLDPSAFEYFCAAVANP